MTKKVFVIDINRCNGCHDCQIVCKDDAICKREDGLLIVNRRNAPAAACVWALAPMKEAKKLINFG